MVIYYYLLLLLLSEPRRLTTASQSPSASIIIGHFDRARASVSPFFSLVPNSALYFIIISALLYKSGAFYRSPESPQIYLPFFSVISLFFSMNFGSWVFNDDSTNLLMQKLRFANFLKLGISTKDQNLTRFYFLKIFKIAMT